MKAKFSGINGTNNIMSSQAKLRVQAGMIDNAVITRVEDGYVIIFAGENSDWNGENLCILETRRHYTNYFKGLPNFKEHRMKMVSSEDPEFIFETFREVLDVYEGFQLV